MDKLQAYRRAFDRLPEGCAAAEVNLVCKEVTEIEYIKGKLANSSASERDTLFVRAEKDGATGIAYCENLEKDPYEVIAMALDNAEAVETSSAQPMKADAHDEHIVSNESRPAVSKLMEKAKELSLIPEVEECSISEYIRTSEVLNSKGTYTFLQHPVYTITLSVCGKGEDNYKMKSVSRAHLEEIDTDEMLRQIRAEAKQDHDELPFIKLPSGEYDAVLSSSMVVNIMNTMWQLFSQRLINMGRSPIQVGEKLGSEKFTIADSAVCPWSGYDYTIDYEGVKGPEKLLLVENGVVKNTLRTLQQGESTGCAGRADLLTANINTEPIPVPRNIWVQPDQNTPEELIAKMGTGIHLTYSMDEFHSLNIDRGTFSIPCGGVYYENGKAVGKLQQMNICGSFKDLFGSLEAVGNDMTMSPMWPHNDYCFGGPSLLVRKATFAM